MGRSPKFTQETKMEIIQRYLNGERLCQLRQTYGFATSSLRSWLKKYRKKGMAGLEPPRINQSYTKEFKERVVQDYITLGLRESS